MDGELAPTLRGGASSAISWDRHRGEAGSPGSGRGSERVASGETRMLEAAPANGGGMPLGERPMQAQQCRRSHYAKLTYPAQGGRRRRIILV